LLVTGYWLKKAREEPATSIQQLFNEKNKPNILE